MGDEGAQLCRTTEATETNLSPHAGGGEDAETNAAAAPAVDLSGTLRPAEELERVLASITDLDKVSNKSVRIALATAAGIENYKHIDSEWLRERVGAWYAEKVRAAAAQEEQEEEEQGPSVARPPRKRRCGNAIQTAAREGARCVVRRGVAQA